MEHIRQVRKIQKKNLETAELLENTSGKLPFEDMALGAPKRNRRLLFFPEGFAPCLLSGLSSFYCSYILSFLLLDFNRKENHKSRQTFHAAGFLKMVLDAAPAAYAAPALADRSRRLPSADNGSDRERAENVLPDDLGVRA